MSQFILFSYPHYPELTSKTISRMISGVWIIFGLTVTVMFLSDIDECALPTGGHICSYRCHNTPGSFLCTCPITGYTLAPNGRSCQGQTLRITIRTSQFIFNLKFLRILYLAVGYQWWSWQKCTVKNMQLVTNGM